MKIGILTFHRACNYGAVLQCYALQEIIKSLGYNVEVIDYRSHNIEKTYRIIKTYNGVRTFVRSLLTMRFTYYQQKNFKKFRDKYLSVSKESYRDVRDFANLNCDCFVIGSDQVWSQRINYGYDNVYWGNFNHRDKKITYAASMGGHKAFTSNDIEIIQGNLDNFTSISVREKDLQEELKSFYNKKGINLVLDPTLVASVDIYDRILEKPSFSNYVLYYQQGYHPFTKEIVSNVAKQLKCGVVVVAGDKEKYDVQYKHYSLSELSVTEFLGLFKYANFVFASSFHGTAFSIIFRKNFYYVGNARVERSKSLLEILGLSNRLIYSERLVEASEVDYNDNIERRISEWIEKSRNYLKNALK